MTVHEIPQEQRDAAFADLKAKVEDMMTDAVKLAIEKLEALQKSGVDIVADHIENRENYATPKDFICAFGRELERQYQRPHPTQGHKRVITNYYRMM